MISIEAFVHAIGRWLHEHLPATVAIIAEWVLIGLFAISLFAFLGLFLVLMERKVAAWMQVRLGPNRVGPKGVLQTLADTIKLISKEPLTPTGADRFLFQLAPFLVIGVAMLLLAPIAFARNVQMWDLNIGVLYVAAMGSVTVIGILIAGWSSNNKYALLGAMRSGAQIVSYELSGGLAILTVVVMAGSLQVSHIVESQSNGWWLVKGHVPAVLAFLIYIVAITAETNRAPFDLPEAESELTAGFHTEYSGMRFALFFLAEYINIFVGCAIGATLFLGGWMPLQVPGWEGFNRIMAFIPSSLWFVAKTFALIFIIMWFRWTFPRLRIDQMLHLEWRYLLPLSLVNLLIATAVAVGGWHW